MNLNVSALWIPMLCLATVGPAGGLHGCPHPGGDPASPRIERIALPTGVELEYLQQGRAHGEVVLFLPGYTDTYASFALNLKTFPRKYRVYALTQRGHGASSKPATGYSQADFVSDAIAFMDAKGIDRAVVVGHSMGSLVAHKLAAEHPSRVSKLVLIGSGATAVGNPGVEWLVDAVMTLEDPVDPEFVAEFQSSTFVRPVPQAYLDTMIENSLLVPATVWQQAAVGLATEDHVAALGNITAPTLVVWGELDGFFGADDQQALLDAIPDATLSVYAGTGHAPHAEQPKRFNRELASFLR